MLTDQILASLESHFTPILMLEVDHATAN